MAPVGRPDRVTDVAEADRRGPSEAGHHGVRVAGRNHAGGEHVAVLVDHALNVALQMPLPLQSAYRKSTYFLLLPDRRALWISMPSISPRPRPANVALTRSSRPIRTGCP